ncbi:MAG: glutamate 5-kinase, partial [Desulfobacteraceae bacterium]|nr:glutamate 5-kinase [Desulfobacteraceae bacterium]
MNTQRKHCFEIAKRIVVKVGSNVLAEDDGLNLNIIRSFSRQISHLTDKGVEVILVSSGAMAAGLRKIGLTKKPDDIPQRQAVAAVGQAGLIMEYEKAFEQYGKKVAQYSADRRRIVSAQTLISMPR